MIFIHYFQYIMTSLFLLTKPIKFANMNIVHYVEGAIILNHLATSKEAILQASRELIMQQGWTSVNIRAIASSCGISVGTIYNYFPSKIDLIAATIESVWCDIFHLSDEETAFTRFSDCVAWVFERMEKGNQKYPKFFTFHSANFLGENKIKGQELMRRSWSHIKTRLYQVLIHDPDVHKDAFNENFTPEQLIDLVFSLILSSLITCEYRQSAIQTLLQRSIYNHL